MNKSTNELLLLAVSLTFELGGLAAGRLGGGRGLRRGVSAVLLVAVIVTIVVEIAKPLDLDAATVAASGWMEWDRIIPL